MELYHYGIKGMKWGVRRYQNKDGTLTPAGKKHLSENAGWYLNPKHGDKHSINRKTVSNDYVTKYDEMQEKEGYHKMMHDPDTFVKQAKLWNSYVDSYADATLKDFGYKSTDAAKSFVKQMFDKDLMYLYDVHNRNTGKYIRTDVDSQSGVEEARDYYSVDYRNKRSI